MTQREPIYLDYAATTPVRPEVREAMAPYLADSFGNPSSTHRWGREAGSALNRARARIAEALGVEPPEVYFVRGGTEGDNLAVLGRVEADRAAGIRPVAAGTTLEHSAVREALDAVEGSGAEAVRLPVTPAGRPREEELAALLAREHVSVLSIMWVNNETGTVVPVPELAERAKDAGVTFHTDAVQAVGKIPVDLTSVPVDMLTLTGHKIYGPKGTGALVVRRGVELRPLHFGGGQERGLRPGTQDVAGAVGLAEAVTLAVDEMEGESRRLEELRDRLEDALTREIPNLRIHAAEGRRAPHILNVGVAGADRQVLLSSLDLEGLAVSGGSACDSGADRASPVLQALYGERAHQAAAVRYSLGRDTTAEVVDRAAEITGSVVSRLSRDAS